VEDDREDVLRDMLADMMHFCLGHEIDFMDRVAHASEHFDEERPDESSLATTLASGE